MAQGNVKLNFSVAILIKTFGLYEQRCLKEGWTSEKNTQQSTTDKY